MIEGGPPDQRWHNKKVTFDGHNPWEQKRVWDILSVVADDPTPANLKSASSLTYFMVSHLRKVQLRVLYRSIHKMMNRTPTPVAFQDMMVDFDYLCLDVRDQQSKKTQKEGIEEADEVQKAG